MTGGLKYMKDFLDSTLKNWINKIPKLLKIPTELNTQLQTASKGNGINKIMGLCVMRVSSLGCMPFRKSLCSR